MLGSEPFVKEAKICREISPDDTSSTLLLGFILIPVSTYAIHVDGAAKGNLRVPGAVGFLDFGRLQQADLPPVLLRADEEGVDVVLEQELVAVATVAGLRLVGALQAVQRGPRDVNAPGRRQRVKETAGTFSFNLVRSCRHASVCCFPRSAGCQDLKKWKDFYQYYL